MATSVWKKGRGGGQIKPQIGMLNKKKTVFKIEDRDITLGQIFFVAKIPKKIIKYIYSPNDSNFRKFQ